MKIVINKCFGGFGLSHEAIKLYHEIKGNKLTCCILSDDYKNQKVIKVNPNANEIKNSWLVHYYINKKINVNDLAADLNDAYWYEGCVERTDPTLIEVVSRLGEKANGNHAKLSIIEVPDGIDWEIDDYDGQETVEEVHRRWS